MKAKAISTQLYKFIFLAIFGLVAIISLQEPVWAQTDIVSSAKTVGSELLHTIQGIYNAIFPFLLGLNIVYLAFFAKDEKKTAISKRVLIWTIVVLVAINGITIIVDWVVTLANKADPNLNINTGGFGM